MPSQNIQWFPGHMAKTRRLISENLKSVDAVIEILDARIPYSSRNPEISKLCAGKPTIILLNKASLADPAITAQWARKYSNESTVCIETDCILGQGISKIAPAIRELCAEKLERYEQKGMHGRALKAMVVGIPNVGKSSLINKLCGKAKAKTGDRPGVTRDKQWIRLLDGLELLDTPGILPPKFEDQRVAVNLAYTGAIRDEIMEIELLCHSLLGYMRDHYKAELMARYKLDDIDGLEGYEILEKIGRKRGCVISGGEIDTERAANILIDELRGCKICPVTLEEPEDFDEEE